MILATVLVCVPFVRAQSDSSDALQRAIVEGNAAVKAGEFDAAIARFQSVLDSLDPDSPTAGDVNLRLGETFRRKGDLESAIRCLARANEILPGNATVIGTLALTLESSGNRVDALRAYRATLDVDPDNAIAMNNLAFLLAETDGDLNEALQLVRRAMTLLPDSMEVADTAGWIHLKRGENDAAIGLFAQAVAGDAKEEGFRDHLLLALERKGERTGVFGDAISALKQEPSQDNLEKLSSLAKALK
jgi:tetratricopeptide (TPR) repeat protein